MFCQAWSLNEYHHHHKRRDYRGIQSKNYKDTLQSQKKQNLENTSCLAICYVMLCYECGVYMIVARTGSVGAGEVLRDGSQREGAAHADVPGLERTRQLCHAHQEEETEAARCYTQPPTSAASSHIIIVVVVFIVAAQTSVS